MRRFVSDDRDREMAKAKNQKHRVSEKRPPSAEPAPRRARPPAWRSRLGLIVAFFAISIGGAYLVVFQRVLSVDNVKTYGFKVVAQYPHDSAAFTEGLLYHGGKIYESTGLEGKSTIRQMDLATSQVVIQKIDDKLFGEGLALWRDRLTQLTYNSGIALNYDLDLKPLDQRFEFEGQGWGLTHDGRFLIMSNGTSELQFRDPESFQLDHRLVVNMGGRRIGRLNELEYVNGKIYANVWHEDYIVEIDPASGEVTARIDLRELLPYSKRPSNPEAVLNGIAFNTDTNRFIVTGKYWPFLYEIELTSREGK